jgi:hypothetical protein
MKPALSTKWKVWTSVFLAITAAALGMEIYGAFDTSDNTPPWTDLLSQYVPEPVTMGLLAVLALWIFPHFWLAYRRVRAARVRASSAPAPTTNAGLAQLAGHWLEFDALNRAWRTFLQTAVAAGAAGALDAGGQALSRALTDKLGGGVVDWRQVGAVAASGALTAFLAPVAAYLHRTQLDPSSIPSAAPPVPRAAPVSIAESP